MDYKDTITYEQPIVKVIHRKEQSELVQTQPYSEILKRLTSTPMTAKDVYTTLQNSDYEKSQPSIYRLLQNLEKENLIIKAGARVYSKTINNQIVTETLYLKSARVLIDAVFRYNYEKRSQRVDDQHLFVSTLGNLLGILYGGKKPNEKSFQEFFLNLVTKVEENIIHIFEQGSNDDLDVLFNECDWKERNGILNYLAWTMFWKERPISISELDECFENTDS